MITQADYWRGRDVKYPNDFTYAVRSNGTVMVTKLNGILSLFEADTGIKMSVVSSGWRPLAVNDDTANAAEHSRHITAQAGDIRDTDNRDLARWCAANQDNLKTVGLWCERFEWTPTWVHFQELPPASGRRFFIPSTAPALVARLPEQDQYNC